MYHNEEIDYSKYEDITGTQEIELSRRMVEGCKQSRNILVHSLMQDVALIAKKYTGASCLCIEELFHEGKLGLYNAVKKYDASKGEKFCTFAYICIFEAIENAIEKEKAKYPGEAELCYIGD